MLIADGTNTGLCDTCVRVTSRGERLPAAPLAEMNSRVHPQGDTSVQIIEFTLRFQTSPSLIKAWNAPMLSRSKHSQIQINPSSNIPLDETNEGFVIECRVLFDSFFAAFQPVNCCNEMMFKATCSQCAETNQRISKEFRG